MRRVNHARVAVKGRHRQMMRWYSVGVMLLFALLAVAASVWPAAAELRLVELQVSGLDCASCVKSVPAALRRVRGVESSEYRPADGVVEIALVRGNSVTLDRLRDALKGLGYTPEDARIQVAGAVTNEEGSWILVCAEPPLRFTLDVPQHPAIRKLFEDAGDDRVVVEGEVPKKKAPGDREVLRVKVARLEEED